MKLKNDFEDYLQEVFMEEHPMILDDELPDAFGDYEWGVEELINHADDFAAQLVEKVIETLPDGKVIDDLTDRNLMKKALMQIYFKPKYPVACYQCNKCKLENTAVLDCGDDDCSCHKTK